MKHKYYNSIYVLSCAEKKDGGGIYKYGIDGEKPEQLKYFACDNPMYAVIGGGNLHVLLKNAFEKNSGYFTVDLNLDNAGTVYNTKGEEACHLAVSVDSYIVNYLSGNTVKNCEEVSAHSGKGINALRQDAPHTHCVIFSPDKEFILVADLGLDTVFVYDRNLVESSRAKVADGYGIRHIIFSKCGGYVYGIDELIPAVSVFAYQSGKLKYLDSIKIPCKKADANGAAIRLSDDGKYLYCSLREENALCVYSADGEKLKLIQKTGCLGDSPRDFNLKNGRIFCANEKSDNVSVFKIKGDGKIESDGTEIKLKAPLCIV